jgi:hypothetical protein
VLSNFSFHNGTTYFVDLKGQGARSILQLNYLHDRGELELVLKHSTREARGEHHILTLPAP